MAGFPTAEQSAVISPTAPACVPQDHLEPVLLDHLRSYPSARVELGTEVVGVEADADGVEVVLRDARVAASARCTRRYLVAADGAHSAVRRALGIPMRGPDHLMEAVTALFGPRCGTWSASTATASTWSRSPRRGMFLPPAAATAGSTASMWEPGEREAPRLHAGEAHAS